MPSWRRPTPAFRPDSTSTTTGSSAARRLPSGSASSRVSSGWSSTRSTRSSGLAPSRSSSGRTCPVPCSRRSDHRRVLVLARGARRLPSQLEEPLGRRDRDRPQAGPFPGQPSHAAGVRWPRGPQRNTQLRRDPLLGRLHPPVPQRLHLRRRRQLRGDRARGALRDRRRPELRPVRRRLDSRAIQQLLDHPRVNDKETPTSNGGVWASETQGQINDDHLSDPAEDTADFSDSLLAICGPTTCCPPSSYESSTAPSSGLHPTSPISTSPGRSRSRAPTIDWSGWM
jgi:hypothetical protein